MFTGDEKSKRYAERLTFALKRITKDKVQPKLVIPLVDQYFGCGLVKAKRIVADAAEHIAAEMLGRLVSEDDVVRYLIEGWGMSYSWARNKVRDGHYRLAVGCQHDQLPPAIAALKGIAADKENPAAARVSAIRLIAEIFGYVKVRSAGSVNVSVNTNIVQSLTEAIEKSYRTEVVDAEFIDEAVDRALKLSTGIGYTPSDSVEAQANGHAEKPVIEGIEPIEGDEGERDDETDDPMPGRY